MKWAVTAGTLEKLVFEELAGWAGPHVDVEQLRANRPRRALH